MAERVLMSEFKALAKEPWTHVELVKDNIFEWNVAVIPVNPESMYYGGYFSSKMTFPKDYPYSPPQFKFKRSVLHPNIYPDGRLCISILHQPGEDSMSGELASERWSPAQRVESVLISILSLLDDAEISSPANVDAGVLFRKDPKAFKAQVEKNVQTSKKDIPVGFVMPTNAAVYTKEEEKHNFIWNDSEEEEGDDFNGSESDAEETRDDDDDEDGDKKSHKHESESD